MERIGLAVIPNKVEHPSPVGHPECYDKLIHVLPELKKTHYVDMTVPIEASDYDLSILKTVHTEKYITKLETFKTANIGYLDPDTFLSASSFDASNRVTWSLLTAVDRSFGDGPKHSFVLGRPPGHHAEKYRGMGFCLVNHIAVAAEYALKAHKVERVAVVDFDIHHGNGTQNIFYDRNDVFYISTHKYPYYPGTGARDDLGEGEGEGYTLNFPMSAGTDDTAMLGVFEGELIDKLRKYKPDLILVSAGFDGHHLDPLGGFKLTGGGFRRMTDVLVSAADELCEGRLVSILEGGYHPEGNLDSITNHIEGLSRS